MNAIISLTSIPRRFSTTLPETLASLKKQSVAAEIVINIPKQYRKWPSQELPSHLTSDARVTVHAPSEDFGPGTKLLGALEYARSRPDLRWIITVDDDIVFRNLVGLLKVARHFPDAAVTFGGVELAHPPYRSKDGLKYKCRYRYVDVPVREY